MSADTDANQLVGDFENNSKAQGVWTAIGKGEVVADLRERVFNMDGLNQQNTGLCGTTALVHGDLQDDPVSFAKLAIALYTAGRAPWHAKTILPSAELLRDPPPDGVVINGTPQDFNRA